MSLSLTFTELEWLLTELKEYVENEKSGGLKKRAHQFSSEATYYFYQLLDSLSEKINQLGLDWFFLEIFCRTINHSDAIKFIRNEQSVIGKIYGVEDEISRDLRSCNIRDQKLDLKRSQELLILLADGKRKTDELIDTHIRVAVMGLSTSPARADFIYKYIWNSFPEYIRRNLWSFNDAGNGVLDKKLVFIYSELISICMHLDRINRSASAQDDDTFRDVTSAILRTVVHSCNLWFNRKDPEAANVTAKEIVGLLQKIDPTNLEFLRSNLRFLETVYKNQINAERPSRGECHEVVVFCRYLLNWFRRTDREKELVSLVTFYVASRLENAEEDIHNIFEEYEIEAVLAEAAFSCRAVQRDLVVDGEQHPFQEHRQKLAAEKERSLAAALPPCSDSVANICFLKTKIFLKQQLNNRNASMLFSDNQLFKVDMILNDLRAFNRLVCQQGNTEFVKQSLILAEELANEIESLHKSYNSSRVLSPLINHSLLQLLFRIVFFKAESFLTELLKSSDTSTALKTDQVQCLVDDLAHFKRIVKIKLPWNSPVEETVIIQLEVFARRITLLSYSYLPNNMKLAKMACLLPQLLDEANVIKVKLGEISQQFPKSTFPKIYGLGFLDFLCRNLRELLLRDPVSIKPVKHHFEEAMLHLESLKSVLKKIKVLDVELEELKDIKKHIIDAAYKLEYVVESIEVDGQLQQSLWLYDVREEIRLLYQQVRKIPEMSYAGKIENVPKIPSRMGSQVTAPEVNEMLVVLFDEEI
ncbi:OLC1v1019178C1 [Oldenlandia corymbosa var. corymbosa]|uniref:OLC1v1019178C1 n=1 Tax=Oldenlandia corymbosa var. corymbosa TaxID=529605 RepID=A0AAV1EDU4_OLDCO|nr:OLC1v1019178C1 [Oldenlandia corymbosa var. corymbosa]